MLLAYVVERWQPQGLVVIDQGLVNIEDDGVDVSHGCPYVSSLGLVTGTYPKSEDEILLTIYIPTIPNPTSGFLAIINKEQVLETDLTFEDAMKIVISAGVLTEEVVRPHLGPRKREPTS